MHCTALFSQIRMLRYGCVDWQSITSRFNNRRRVHESLWGPGPQKLVNSLLNGTEHNIQRPRTLVVRIGYRSAVCVIKC